MPIKQEAGRAPEQHGLSPHAHGGGWLRKLGAALRLLVTQSEHSLVYGVQKVCVPKTRDLRTFPGMFQR